jgi:release factor glutamine methyltransferase
VPSADIATLAPEIARFEPRLALDGGRDGLASYRALAADVARLLAPDGAAILEFGFGQSAAVAGIMAAAGLQLVEFVSDLAGLRRCARLAPGARFTRN